ncbi:MAG: TonB-dependent receptor, partial [Gammaproteobacteria bacterium]
MQRVAAESRITYSACRDCRPLPRGRFRRADDASKGDIMVGKSYPGGLRVLWRPAGVAVASLAVSCLSPRAACAQGAAVSAPGPAASTSGSMSANASTDQLQEVIVTARRRSESLQQVPVAVSAIDAETLQRQDVQTLTDLQLLIPSAYVSEYAHGSGQQFFSLRGQSESGLNTGGGAGGGPAVVGYFSEVPTQMSGPGLYYDLQSVEVLNGPQGTLFGRNTTGGAVLFEPRRPDLRAIGGYAQ